MMGSGYGHDMWFGGGFMWVIWPLILIAVVLLVVKAVQGSNRGGDTTQPPPRTALEILEERYARGEIEREEFEQKRSDLQGH